MGDYFFMCDSLLVSYIVRKILIWTLSFLIGRQLHNIARRLISQSQVLPRIFCLEFQAIQYKMAEYKRENEVLLHDKCVRLAPRGKEM